MRRHINFQNQWRSWSKEEITKLRNEFIKGTPIKDIASKLNRNDDAVVFRLIKIGILGYPHEPDSDNHGQIWSESEKNLLLKEYKEGKSIEEMAKTHRRNKNAILFQLILCRAFDFTSRTELEKYLHQDSADLVGHNDIDSNQNTGGDSKMGFERIPFNTTKTIQPKGSNLLTGRPDAIFLRNKYQKELDNAWASVVNMVHYVEEESQKLRDAYSRAQGLKQDIKAHEAERSDLYESLGNLLTKETNFEDKMWQTTQKGRKVKSVTVKQNIKESDVDEMRFDSMMDYIKQYPEYSSKSSFKKILDKIDQKEGEIRQAKKMYNDAVSKYNYYLSFFEKHIQKAEDKFVAYDNLLKEGKDKLDNCRYRKSMFYKMASEEVKAEVNLDIINHRVDQFKNTLEILKGEFVQNQRKTFVEMEY
jgi:hypothetical protein